MQILVGYEEVGHKSVRSQSRSRSTGSFDEFSRDEKSDAVSRSNVRNVSLTADPTGLAIRSQVFFKGEFHENRISF